MKNIELLHNQNDFWGSQHIFQVEFKPETTLLPGSKKIFNDNIPGAQIFYNIHISIFFLDEGIFVGFKKCKLR